MKYLLAFLSFFFIACKQESSKVTQTVDVELVKNERYIYDTKNSGDEQGGKIISQAQNYNINELKRDDSTFKLLYTYQPAADYVGKDVVKLELSSLHMGSTLTASYKYVTINFTITDQTISE